MVQFNPAELVLANFIVDKLYIHNSEPFIKISFEIKSKDNNQIYTLYSGHCEIRSGSFIIANTSVVPDPDRWIGGQSGALEVPSFINGLNISMDSQSTIPTKSSMMFTAVASLSSDVLMLINNEFECDPSSTDALPLNAEIRIPTMIFIEENRQIIPRGGAVLKFNVEYQLSRKNWLQWIGSWGYKTTLMYLPTDIYSKIKELALRMGYTKEWEVVAMALRNPEPLGLNTVRRSHSSDRALSERIKTLIVNSRRYLYIAVQTIDGTFSDDIVKAAKRDVQVKIIIGPLRSDKQSIGSRNPIIKALSELNKYSDIKIKDDWHGRMIIVDGELIVGSLDLDRQGLTVHDNVVTETDEQTVVERAKEIFYELASQSRPLELSSTDPAK